ncbi:amidohydrolase [Erysipelothrix aquatica]|uniref:amidohydrolase n=1 Tax=Erysipelothrix aquatica TaxID=2683714 RepID=UPI001356DFBA|nr:amidohydrolase [Erysipelothrix aquatica]
MLWIKNVLLEKGYVEYPSLGYKTDTELSVLGIEHGKIVTISDTLPDNATEIFDAQGYLAIPSLVDNHIHLDKGHLGGPWQAVVPMQTVADRIHEEEGFLESFLVNTPQRAQELIDLVSSYGATFLRVHVNVDPVVGLKNLQCIRDVLESNAHRMDFELVAFPQHGTLATENDKWLTHAMQQPGVNVIGGLDPATIDRDIDASLTVLFELAQTYHKEIDIHLHDHGTLGIFEIERIVDYTEKYGLEGRVQISHAYALGDVSLDMVAKIAQRLATFDIAINTTVPIDTSVPHIPTLQKAGVRVHVINDNINDHWSPFGTGDLLQRASRAAERFNLTDEISLSQSLGLVTKGITPLTPSGDRVWPKIGDCANILFVKAESSAHAIARVPRERVLMFKGAFMTPHFRK